MSRCCTHSRARLHKPGTRRASIQSSSQITGINFEKQEKQKQQKLGRCSVDPKPTDSDNKLPTGLVVGSIVLVSAFAIGSIVLVKSKFSKSKNRE